MRFLLASASLAALVALSYEGKADDSGWTSPSSYKSPEIVGTPLDGLKVALDVGHSLSAYGATSACGNVEYQFNAETARVIKSILESAGATVVLINEDGKMENLYERGPTAGQIGADCFISIHHDSVNDKYLEPWVYEGRELTYCDRFHGYGVFTSTKNLEAKSSRLFALQVGKALYETGLRPTLHHNEPIQGENRPLIEKRLGVYEFTDLVVLKTAPMPAILLECGVIVHREEEQLVQESWYRELLGHALAKGLIASLDSGAIKRSSGSGLFSKQKPIFPFLRPKSGPPPAESKPKQEGGLLKKLFEN